MASFGRQLLLLLWKNWTLQKRSICVTLFEVLLPLFFGAILVLIRVLVKTTDFPNATIWPALNISNPSEVFFVQGQDILYSPNTSIVKNVMIDVEKSINNKTITTQQKTVKGFRNEYDLMDYHNLYPDKVWGAVVFDSSESYEEQLPADIRFDLRVTRMSKGDKWLTDFTYNFIQTTSPRNTDANGGNPNYVQTGFIWLQYEVDRALIAAKSGSANLFSEIQVQLKKMPYPPYLQDPLLTAIQQNLPLFLMLGFILYVIQTAKNLVYEKERKLKEAMKMMGLSPAVYWMSWFAISFIYLVIACVVFTVLLSVKVSTHGSVLANSDPTLTFVFFLVYAMSVIALAFMISTFFKKANTAAFAGGMIHFLTYFPYFFLGDDNRFATMSRTEKITSCILSNNAMAFGVKALAMYEGTGEGARWNNFYKEPTVDSNFTMFTSIIMMLIDTAVYLIITWYLDAVMPGEFGVPEPLYFPFTKRYWFGTSQKSGLQKQTSVVQQDSTYFEKDPEGLRVGIAIEHLRKVFGSGKTRKVAVRDTTVNMYEGQITALLGHNGAGKTTTMSMLTGFIPPTSGTAKVNGYDIREDITSVRGSLGLCPQHNILFDTMTVEEHLIFFAKLKGCPTDQVKKEVDEMIYILGLEAKRNKFSKTLSGGQKRKLSVGIALIAGSKTVILDEPTSGMDPAARRQTWDILQKFKDGRTIVLSTHFMDEADLLGDRIAIMAEGVVKCCGTSYFLKKTYGAGYHLIIVKEKTCLVSRITELVKSHIASAALESEISAELSYLLPFDESENFEKLLLEIEERSVELCITSFGTTATTMEEVFLKVGKAADLPDDSEEDPNSQGVENPLYSDVDHKSPLLNGHSEKQNGYGTSLSNGNGVQMTETAEGNFIAFNKNIKKNTGFALVAQQFYGMFLKKVIHTFRNQLVTGVQLVVPVIFTIMALSTELSIPKPTDEPPLTLDLKPFGTGLTELYSAGDLTTNLSLGVTSRYQDILQLRGDVPGAVREFPFDNAVIDTTKSVGLATFNKKYIIGLDIERGTKDSQPVNFITAYFNGQPFHSPPISISYAMNALLKHVTNNNTQSITTRNNPLPLPIKDNSRNLFFSTLGTGFVVAFTVIFGMAFLIASFTLFLIKERTTGARHLQRVSGVSTGAFWFSNFAWDMINYLVPVLCIIVVFAAFNTAAFNEDHRLGILFSLFMLFGWGSLPFVYLIQFVFKTPPAGMVALSMLNILSGLATLMAVFVLKIPDLGTEDVATALDWIFAIVFPTYCMGSGIMNVYTNYGYTKGCEATGYPLVCEVDNTSPCCPGCTGTCFKFQDNYLAWDFPGSGKYFVFMAVQGTMFFLLLFLIETGKIQKFIATLCNRKAAVGSYSHLDEFEESIGGHGEEDSDVKLERERINATEVKKLTSADSIVIKNLNKNYGGFQAVNDICVSVGKQECFGLLGQNGAGKTTTFKMLTGDVIPTSGNAWMNSHDIQSELTTVHKLLGYCPQFDALIDQMTGKEILTMFGRLRGVQESQLGSVVENLIDIMMLKQYANRECGNYSGGNKRKLSTAIALIGDPQFIFLDEPTTGMDPGARRQLWNVLSQVRASGRTLVLTSHSMEECDALCTKIVIMVNGQFVCCGSSQHLKSKFGDGYTLICNMKNTGNGQDSSMQLKQYLCEKFPRTKIFDVHQGYCHFQITDKNVSLGLLFGAMEKAKKQFNVEDYHIHQATLEQIFLAFTRNQVPPKEEFKTSICKQMCCCCLCCS